MAYTRMSFFRPVVVAEKFFYIDYKVSYRHLLNFSKTGFLLSTG